MFGQLQDKFSKIFKVIRGHGKVSENNISDEDMQLANELWLESVNYKEWNQHQNWTGIQSSSDGTHGSHVQIWFNDSVNVSIEQQQNLLANNSILVKEGYSSNSESSLAAITIMKKIAGYDPENSNWFWAKFNSDGSVDNAGAINNCISRHSLGQDYIRFIDLQ